MSIVEKLQNKGVQIPAPNQIQIGEEVIADNIEPNVVLLPGIVIQGSKTMLGQGTVLGPGGTFCNVRCGRRVKLQTGYYENCVFLNGTEIRSNAEMRAGTIFMEEAQAAHTVGCKMTILGMRVILGSLINFCDVFVSGGNEEPFGFTEIGSGAIHYNFTPNGLKFGSLIGPGALGEMYGLYPKTFIGGQTQIIAPTMIGHQVLVPAGTSVRQPIPSGVLSIDSALAPGKKAYQPSLITSAKEKFWLTAVLIIHYQALSRYFTVIRKTFAQSHHDAFLEHLYEQANEMIQINIQERLKWLFSQTERHEPANLFGKLSTSLKLHQQELNKRSKNKISFYLQQIEEHSILLMHKDLLEKQLQQTAPQIPQEVEFLSACQPYIEACASYAEFITSLPFELKRQGQNWLQTLITQMISQIQETLQNSKQSVEIVQQSDQYVQAIRPYFGVLQRLYQNHKFLFSGDWDNPELGIINRNLDEYSDLRILSWQMLAIFPADQIPKTKIEKLMRILEQWPSPAVIHWPYLVSMLHNTELDGIGNQLIRRAIIRFHGTDGVRGPTAVPEQPLNLEKAIVRFVQQHELTPKFFSSLVRNSIYAYCILYGQQCEAVLIGCDPRDIYSDNPQRQHIFYKAVIDGALTTGKRIYDLGVVPIPAIAYMLAHWDCPGSPAHVPLAIYKTASHNPAAQDGIKLFMQDTQAPTRRYVKATWELETVIAALMVQEALSTESWYGPTGQHYKAQPIAAEVLRRVITNPSQMPNLSNVLFMAMDLANGAFAWPHYQEILLYILQYNQIKNTVVVGKKPDGKNINHNQGQDRVGAAHLENIHHITREEIQPGGKFFGFPAINSLFEFGANHQEELRSGKTAWAIFTDGDGDRSYAALYNPYKDDLHLIDGDESFFYQIHHLLEQGKLRPGSMIAFTVESSVPFINALLELLQKYHPVQLIYTGEVSAIDKINVKLCPVGDKHILRSQCMGTESSGHLVKPYEVMASDGQITRMVFTGNGPMSALHTIAAVDAQMAMQMHLPFQERLQQILIPYAEPYNNILYIYFIQKKLWYYNSPLWQSVYQQIARASQPYDLSVVIFPEEEDTLYLISQSSTKWQFSILARPSGTENKFGIKFFGTADQKELFDRMSQELYIQIAPLMKDYSLRICRDERKLLEILNARKHEAVLIQELEQQIVQQNTASERAYFMSLVEALSDKCQKLAEYDGLHLKIKERGLLFLNQSLG